MIKRVAKYAILAYVFYFLCSNTLTVKYVAPICYRLDFSMIAVLFAAVCFFEWDDRTLCLFGAKEVLTLVFGNPGVSIPWHVMMTLSNALMDAMLLLCFWQLTCHDSKKIRWVSLTTLIYTIFCVALNILYHARLSAAAYHTDIAGLIRAAGMYNVKVRGFWSLHFHTLTKFYITEYLLVIGVTALIIRWYKKRTEERAQYAYFRTE